MIAPIQQISPIGKPELAGPAGAPSDASGFRDLLTQSISTVEEQQNSAKAAVNAFLTGEGGELHTAAIAGQRAELSLQMFLQVRNKVVSAYQEIMRMQM